LTAALFSAFSGYEVADRLQKESNTKIADSNARAEEAKKEAAQANERAVTAQLELAKFKAPRVLSDDQIQSLAREMLPFKGQRVSVGAVPATFETVSLADQILHALLMAGMNADANPGAAQVQVGIVRGVVARAITGNAKGERFAATFVKALTEKGISATAMDGLLESVMDASIKQGRGRNDPGHEWVVIVVGDKP
ncbi:MAG TPA: hypothetical protein VLY45_04075, partial [Nitrospiria bacterium]|nr:hypothetical protein [Nitrospiria bacterium]